MQKIQTTLTRQIKYLLLGLTLFFCHPSFGQQSNIDSLLSLIKKDKADTNKVNHLNALGRELCNSNPDTAIILSTQALSLAEKTKWKIGIGKSHHNLGWFAYLKGEYPKALQHHFKALKTGEEIENKKLISSALSNIGSVYFNQGDYPKALDYYFRALKMGEESEDKNGIATQLGNIGNVYHKQSDYSKALNYKFKALKMDEELGNKNGIARHLGNIGVVYYEQGDYPKALDYSFRALKMAEELGNKNLIATWLVNIGSIYTKQKKYDEAYDYLYRSLALSDSIGAKDYVKEIYSMLSTLYENSNIVLNDSIGGNLLTMEGMRLRALYYNKRYILVKDNLFSQEQQKQIMTYEFDKKEAAAKAEQDKKDAVTVEEKRKQKIITYSVSGGLFLVLLFALFIFRGYRQKQKANRIIEKKNQIIEEKNKNITDSINYAKRIQQAKLPDRKEIYSAFPNSFVLFKPKDIVSGDFYYFHKNEKIVFIAAADCTGHGVPGAFMSMIGSEKLDDALAHSADTSEILRYLNKGIKVSLRQTDSQESTRDGMDIALCSVDTDTRVVKYAGANRPLWIIRNEQTAVEEIKATKKAIGGLTEDDQHFDTHTIQLHNGDTFYISTDGYADTFSGADSKKLTTKRFKEILISIQDKSLKEQGQHLDNFIENWKAGTEQVDDILVIGIRF